MIFICYPKCTTCQKARAWLDEHHITYNFRDIKLENPTYDELAAWHEHMAIEKPLINWMEMRFGLLDSKNGDAIRCWNKIRKERI